MTNQGQQFYVFLHIKNTRVIYALLRRELFNIKSLIYLYN